MHIPKRYIKKKEEVKPPVQEVKKVVEVKDNSKQVVSEINKVRAEIKQLIPVKKSAPKYVFTMHRDANGLLEQVVATPVETDTIL